MSGRPMTEEDLAELSDDELMGMAAAPTAAPAPSGSPENDEVIEEVADATTGDDPDSLESGTDAEDPVDEPSASDKEPEEEAETKTEIEDLDDDSFSTSEEEAQEKAKPEPKEEAEKKEPTEVKSKEEDKTTEVQVDYKAAYEQIMAPFKAAGKTIQLQSPEEVVQLMQMGAHYTKKMQALQPNLKLLRMLQNNDLLDEGKLSYLIDINRKDPAAIQKLVRESGIDPMDIDTSVEPAYKPGNHQVSDEEIKFQQTLEEVTSDPVGKDLVYNIHQTWDKTSKEAIFTDPNIMKVLADQKNNGIYDTITTEIERRKTLGILGNEPFLQSYEQVGKELQAQGKLTPRPTNNPQPQPAPVPNKGQADHRRVVETRPAATKTVSNSDRARAASPTRAAPKKAVAQDFNPLALSDEDFEKNAALASRL